VYRLYLHSNANENYEDRFVDDDHVVIPSPSWWWHHGLHHVWGVRFGFLIAGVRIGSVKKKVLVYSR